MNVDYAVVGCVPMCIRNHVGACVQVRAVKQPRRSQILALATYALTAPTLDCSPETSFETDTDDVSDDASTALSFKAYNSYTETT